MQHGRSARQENCHRRLTPTLMTEKEKPCE
jgi:hypothetical protein